MTSEKYLHYFISFDNCKKKMKDKDIRAALLSNPTKYLDFDSNSIIIQELGLCQGEARIDIAIIKEEIHGYEIKSTRDNLSRLQDQAKIYNRTLDYITLIVSSNHLKKALDIVPSWWGVVRAECKEEKVSFSAIRSHRANPLLDPEAIIQLIWKEEAFNILQELKLHEGIKKKTKWMLWDRLIENLSINEIKKEVVTSLKSRQDWRSDLQLM